jgi:hypothetical protein
MGSMISQGSVSGGGSGGSNPGASKNYVVNTDADALALPALKAGDTVRIRISAANNNETRWWQVDGPGAWPAVPLIELETLEAVNDSLTVAPVANEAARLLLPDKYNPFRMIKQTDTGWTYMQTANPASDARNWVIVTRSRTDYLTNTAINITSGSVPITLTTGA